MDGRRRAPRRSRLPETVGFLTKPQIALEQIRVACEADLPRGVVLMDAGYGTDTGLREAIGALGLTYIAGIQPQTSVWAPGTAPLPTIIQMPRRRIPILIVAALPSRSPRYSGHADRGAEMLRVGGERLFLQGLTALHAAGKLRFFGDLAGSLIVALTYGRPGPRLRSSAARRR